MKRVAALIKINKMLEAASWRLIADANGPAPIPLEPKINLKAQCLDALGEKYIPKTVARIWDEGKTTAGLVKLQ